MRALVLSGLAVLACQPARNEASDAVAAEPPAPQNDQGAAGPDADGADGRAPQADARHLGVDSGRDAAGEDALDSNPPRDARADAVPDTGGGPEPDLGRDLGTEGDAAPLCLEGARSEQRCGDRVALIEPSLCVAGAWIPDGPCVDTLCERQTPGALGGVVGAEASVGSERGSCGGGGLERAFAFTAPATRPYRFDTVGLAYGAALYLRSDCAAPATELLCVAGMRGTPPSAEATLAAGQTVTVMVDALGAHGGEIPLKITDLCTTGEPLLDGPIADLGPIVGDLGTAAFAPGPGEFGVAWLEADGRGGVQANFARIGVDGAPLQAPRLVADAGAPALRLALVGEGYVLVYQAPGEGFDLRVARLEPNPDGDFAVVDDLPLPVPLLADGVRPDFGTPELAPNGDGLLVVVVERATSQLFLYGLDARGALILGPQRLATGVSAWPRPDLQVGPTGLGATWGVPAPDGQDLVLGRFDEQLQPVGPPLLLVAARGPPRRGTLARSGDALAVAYAQDQGGGERVYVRRFDASGTDLGETEIAALGREPADPDVAALDGYFGVAFRDGGDPDADSLYFQTLSVDGVLGPGRVRVWSAAAAFDLNVSGSVFAIMLTSPDAPAVSIASGVLACPPE